LVKLIIQNKTGGAVNMANNNTGRNRALVPEAQNGLDQFKYEIASEIGLSNYANIDKGNLTSRENGYVGGLMVKRMVEAYERNLAGRGGSTF
jgi:N-acetylmuramoyl-L-alanine amidase CwlA